MNKSTRQTVYVPIYSHIYSGLKGSPFSLAATLSIRNAACDELSRADSGN